MNEGRAKRSDGKTQYSSRLMGSVIETLSRERSDIIFMLWGNYAKDKIRLINADKHYILTAVHPSPLAGNGFIGCSHFASANQILESRGETPINWQV